MLVLKGGVGVVIGGENGSWNGVRLPVFLPSMCLQKNICSEAKSIFVVTLQASFRAGTSRLWCLYKHFVVRVKAPLLCGYKPLVLMLNTCMC